MYVIVITQCIEGGKRQKRNTLMTPLKEENLVPHFKQKCHPLGPYDVNTNFNKKANITKRFF